MFFRSLLSIEDMIARPLATSTIRRVHLYDQRQHFLVILAAITSNKIWKYFRSNKIIFRWCFFAYHPSHKTPQWDKVFELSRNCVNRVADNCHAITSAFQWILNSSKNRADIYHSLFCFLPWYAVDQPLHDGYEDPVHSWGGRGGERGVRRLPLPIRQAFSA